MISSIKGKSVVITGASRGIGLGIAQAFAGAGAQLHLIANDETVTARAEGLGGTGAGRPSPFIQVKLLDDAGKEVAAGEVGEIAVRGSMLMNGYHNRANENAVRSSNGWHRTRDLGKRLEDGSLAFMGPKTPMIKSAFENIYPAEVEACLRLHPSVANVCVIGIPDPKWDQRVKAVVELRVGQEASADELIEHCKSHIASYKKPSVIQFADALPRTAAGGVDRNAVDAAHGGGGYPATAK